MFDYAPENYLKPFQQEAIEVTGYQVVESPKLNLDVVAKDKIELMQKAMEMGETFGPEEFPTEHFHAPGLYGRYVTVPENFVLITQIHKTEHITMAMKGTFTMYGVDGTLKKVVSPAMWITPPGTKRAIYCHDEVIIANVHPANAETQEEAEAQVYAQSWEEFERLMLEA